MQSNRRLLWSVIAFATFLVGFAGAQEPRAPNVVVLPPGATVQAFDAGNPLIVAPPAATTVQLPTFNFFTVQTSVLVPDRGGMVIGGVNSGAAGSHWNGGPGLGSSSGYGSSLVGGTTSVGVQVVDLQEIDRRMRARSAADPDVAAANAWAKRLEQARQSSAGRPTISVAEARRLRK